MIYSAEKRIAHQERMLAFIESEIAAGRGFPDRHKLLRHFGWRDMNGVRRVLRNLEDSGYLERRPSDGERKWLFAIPGGPSETPPQLRPS